LSGSVTRVRGGTGRDHQPGGSGLIHGLRVRGSGSGRRFKEKPVFPAVNTKFMGASERQGVWAERCQGCGDCVLGLTGGVCPIARCSKRLLNGPCGGSSRGKCEINPEVDCAWQLIWDRLKALGLEKRYEDIAPAKDWRASRDGGPRRIIREDLAS
jgi:hypothetical protein